MKRSFEYYCSFCGKASKEIERLIAGPETNICNECIDYCSDILKEKTMEEGQKILEKAVTDEQLNAIKAANDTRRTNEYISDMETKTNFYIEDRKNCHDEWHLHAAKVEVCNYIQAAGFLVIVLLFGLAVMVM